MIEAISRLAGKSHFRILFVCLGNICRSPAAQGVMQDIVDKRCLSDRFVIESAGLYGGHAGDLPDKRMRVHAFQRGYRLEHRSTPVRMSDFEDYDLIVAMDDSNFDNLKRKAPTVQAMEKVVKMAWFFRNHPGADCVPDPYYEGAAGFEYALDLIEDGCETLVDQLTSSKI
ncbi:MAG: low molecular weight phosphotyrosine protein phosphatase [Muribaculum sp.]|nr:low molecular weight phosphotyrosine protein phosphatase [Muribaculum sp.]